MYNSLKELWTYRELLFALTAREIKVRYKQTILGFAWAVLQPLLLTLIFSLIFSIFLKVETDNVPYPIFAFSALVPWMFFSNSLSFGSLSVVNNSNLVTKVSFPREILPLASVGAALFDFIMTFVVFLLLFFLFDVQLTWTALYIVILIVPVLLLTAGLSFALATVNVLYRDVKFVIPLLLQLWLYLTPIIYSSSSVPSEYRFLLILNPMSSLIENFRNVTVYGANINFQDFIVSFFVSIGIFIIGYLFFKREERIFADVM